MTTGDRQRLPLGERTFSSVWLLVKGKSRHKHCNVADSQESRLMRSVTEHLHGAVHAVAGEGVCRNHEAGTGSSIR